MEALAFAMGLLLISQTDAMQEFSKHSNGSQNYAIVWTSPCDQGLTESGYAMPVGKTVVLKQLDEDGEAGEVCTQ